MGTEPKLRAPARVETGVNTRRLIALAGIASVAAVAPSAAETLRPTQSRPHSSVVIRDAYNVATDRLSASIQPDHGRLRVRIDFSARSRSGKRAVLLRAGRCVRGELASPSCPPSFTRHVVLYPNKTVHITATAFLRRPPKRQDSIRIFVTRPGKQPPTTRPIAELALRGSAWRALAGRVFGYAVHSRAGVTIRAVRASGTGVSTERLRGTFTWDATSAADLDARTVISPCVEGAPKCTVNSTPSPLAAGQRGTFFQRPTLFRAGATTYTFQLVAPDSNAPLFVTLLPWPG
jgi:hypothetical protein